ECRLDWDGHARWWGQRPLASCLATVRATVQAPTPGKRCQRVARRARAPDRPPPGPGGRWSPGNVQTPALCVVLLISPLSLLPHSSAVSVESTLTKVNEHDEGATC